MSAQASTQQQVKEVLTSLLLAHGLEDEPGVHKLVNKSQKLARDSGGLLLPRPRRGIRHELRHQLPMMAQLSERQKVQLPEQGSQLEDRMDAERWRDAEALLLAPHTFSELRKLPELQQLVSFTAVAAIQAAASPGHHERIAAEAAATLFPVGCMSSPEVAHLMHETAANHTFADAAVGKDARLLEALAPQLRLALAAEVAVGMLCPEQPAPRDTPEHAATLQLFLHAAAQEAMQECQGGSDRLRRCVEASEHTRSRSRSSGSSEELVMSALPSSDKARAWDLAPLLDLQLQVPPQLLLQLLVQLQERLQQGTGTQQQQQQPGSSSPLQEEHDTLALFERLARGDTLAAVDSLLRPGLFNAVHVPVMDHLHASGQSSAQHEQSLQQQHDPVRGSTEGQLTPGSSSSSIADEWFSTAAAAILQSGLLGPDAVDNIASLAYLLVLGFLQGQLSEWGCESQQWQQAVPLQALQLLSAVRGVEAAGQAAVHAACAAQTGPTGSSGTTSWAGSLHAAGAGQSAQHSAVQLQQQLVHMLVSLVQRVRHYRDCNAALQPNTQSSSRRDYGVLPPHKSFAAAEEQCGLGSGIWHSAGMAAPASPEASSSSSSRSSQTSNSSTGYAAGTWGSAQCEAVEGVLRATARVQELLQHLDEHLQHACSNEQALAESLAYLAPFAEEPAVPDDLQKVVQWVKGTPERSEQVQKVGHFLQSCGVELLDHSAVADCIQQNNLLAASLHSMRQQLLTLYGAKATAAAWEAHVAARGGLSGLREDSSSSSREDAAVARRLRQRWGESDDRSDSGSVGWLEWGMDDSTELDSSSSNGSNGLKDVRHKAQRRLTRMLLSLGCIYTRKLVAHGCHDMRLSYVSLWQLEMYSKTTTATRLSILRRIGSAKADPGSAESAAEEQSQVEVKGSSSSSQRWLPGPCDWHPKCRKCRQEQQEQQQQQPADLGAASSTLGSSSGKGGSSARGRSKASSPYASWAVPYDDPYLFRRLLWRLLGKLSPEAQALYSQHAGMCPHCNEFGQWMVVQPSLEACLWSPEGADITDLSLSTHHKPCKERSVVLRQYARAINSSFVRGYHPSLVLVSKQVLLALSPLHHQVLPQPEVAHLLPSSFGPAVGKALMQQVFDAPVLDAFQYEHPAGRLQLYHVWWHVGLRVYAQRQQQQQAALRKQPQQDVPVRSSGKNHADCNGRQHSTSSKGKSRRQRDQRQVKAGSNGGKGGSRSSCDLPAAAGQQEQALAWQGLTSSELETLYLNPEARLFAVGFAVRQLSGLPEHLPLEEVRLRELHQAALQLAQNRQVTCLREQACSADGSMQPLPLPSLQQLQGDGSSCSQEDVLIDTLCEAVSFTDALAAGQPELLAAVSGPRDMLIPPAQQKLQPSAQRSVGGFQALCHYFAHCPGLTEVQRAQEIERSERQQRVRAGTGRLALQPVQQQQRREEDPLAALYREQQLFGFEQQKACNMAADGPTGAQSWQQSDVEALGLQAPCLALADPQVYWRWQQVLLRLHVCDVCGEYAAGRMLACSSCHSAVYCSGQCQEQGAELHSALCDKLWQAQQRYSAANASVCPSTSSFPVLAQLLHPGHSPQHQAGLSAMSGLDGPAFPHGRSLVPTEELIYAMMNTIKE